jgi:hypothetical protein
VGAREAGDCREDFRFLICFILSSVAGGFMRLAPVDAGESKMRKIFTLEAVAREVLKLVLDGSKMESKMGCANVPGLLGAAVR